MALSRGANAGQHRDLLEDRNDRKNARNLFSSFLKRHYPDVLISGRQVGSYKGQPISYSFRTGSLTSPGRIVVGEAGSVVDPASGEGIYQALCSGVLAGQALHEILASRGRSSYTLKQYETACRKTFDQSFRLGQLIRHFVGHGGLDVLPKVIPNYLLGGLCKGLNNFHPVCARGELYRCFRQHLIEQLMRES